MSSLPPRASSVSHVHREIVGSRSALSFGETGGGGWDVWDRFLELDGKPAFHIGNVCGTCRFFFERLPGANRTLSIDNVRGRLNEGSLTLSDPVVDAFAELLPDGPYEVVLQSVRPQLVALGGPRDYFAHEQTALWGMDPFWGLPHHPRIQYYRAGETTMSDGQMLFQLIVPFVAQSQLDIETVHAHRMRIRAGAQPTAVALSVLDVKAPVDFLDVKDQKPPSVTTHWCWTHYLIDGHHKILAAAQEDSGVSLLSFLAVSKGVSTAEDVTQMLARVSA